MIANPDPSFPYRPIVHRAGGMLIQAKKEFVICADLQPHDVFFYYTTTLARPSIFIWTSADLFILQGVDDVELSRSRIERGLHVGVV